ncbi:hypothetical protein FPV67DRAFT_1525250 [Lyophyllum atratum]|nr:hypothetical protein FPV67DRAFT_1525250 [Lyophyllum atratum]
MRRLSTDAKLYPKGFHLEGIDSYNEEPLAGGGFADIYKGPLQGEGVCLKIIRVYKAYQVDHVFKGEGAITDSPFLFRFVCG